MSSSQAKDAALAVPVGCKRVECQGISYSRTRCKAPECLELIRWLWARAAEGATPENPTFDVGFHVIGRDISKGMPQPWKSKQDVGPVYTDITDPNAHFNQVYGEEIKGKFMGRPGYMKPIMACFCCDTSKMTLMPPPASK